MIDRRTHVATAWQSCVRVVTTVTAVVVVVLRRVVVAVVVGSGEKCPKSSKVRPPAPQHKEPKKEEAKGHPGTRLPSGVARCALQLLTKRARNVGLCGIQSKLARSSDG
uniref:Putative secreted protein n=1 Tax=Anopheles darlingi TaxID=43151 RepID=A0A2M4DFR9_ANODA